MANTAKRRRRRSRKPRPEASPAASEIGGADSSSPAPVVARGSRRRASKESSPKPAAQPPPTSTYGARPHSPWHPLPLSEILILLGAVGVVIALRREAGGHGAHSHALLVASLLAAAVGTAEVTWREHRSGYRSHAILLAVAVVLVFHSAIVLGASALAHPAQLLNFVLLPIDFALFVFLFRMLRARFLEARHMRALGRG